ncbi:hypothetical protein J2X14_003813 [Pantoea alhagi]|uniref:hypothetical protein n=1 Tax=Mixta sp. BE291 TaxID=3158787 RepID=UPI0028615FA0|nr:hypothetical protein [Pantoea alhagi]
MREGTVVISVNGIEVGAMPLEQYEEIVRSVNKDWRIRACTVLDNFRIYFKFAKHALFTFIRSLGVIAAIFMIACLFRPETEVAGFIKEIQSATPEGLAYTISTITTMCICLTIMYYMFRLIFGRVPECLSPSKIAISQKIREVMEVPTKGKVSVTFIKNGAYCVR